MRWLFWKSDVESPSENKSTTAPKDASPTAESTNPTPSSYPSIFTSQQQDAPKTPSTFTKQTSTDWNASLNAINWSKLAEPQNVIPTVILTSGVLFCVHLHRRFLRRIPDAPNISPSYFRKRSLFGRVTSVGDGDNFRMYHTPGGRLAGWGWLPWKKIPTTKRELKDRTIHVRLAGIDAPELPHFGRPAQPFSQEAHQWLTAYLQRRLVRAYVHRPDQYGRVVATVHVRRWLIFRRDVGLQMLRQGLATVYEAKSGVEFGGERMEKKYRRAEWWAKKKRKGLWKGWKGQDWESPREYKTRMGMPPEENGDGKGTAISPPPRTK